MTNFPKNPKPHFNDNSLPPLRRGVGKKVVDKVEEAKILKIIEANRKIEEEYKKKNANICYSC